MKEKIKVKFPKGIHTVNIPFMAKIGSYDQLYEAIEKIEPSKAARWIEATLKVNIDLKKEVLTYTSFQVSVSK